MTRRCAENRNITTGKVHVLLQVKRVKTGEINHGGELTEGQ